MSESVARPANLSRLDAEDSRVTADSYGRNPVPRRLRLKKAKLTPMRNTALQLQRLARERADEQARRIPWRRLLDTRTQYIDWQEFYLWARSILEVEGQIPNWLVDVL